MNIVHLITAFHMGGAEKVAIDLAKKVGKESFSSKLISIFKDSSDFGNNIKNELKEENIPFQEFGIKNKYSKLKYFGMMISSVQLFLYLKKDTPDIIHSHTDFPDLVLSIVLRLYSFFGLKQPKVVRTIHNTQLWPTHPKIGKFVETMYQNDSVVFISNGSKNAYYDLRKKCLLETTSNEYFIYNGIDFSVYTNMCDQTILKNQKVVLTTNKINLLFVGRLVHQKGFDLLIDTLKLLSVDMISKIHIYVFGDGELKKLLNDKNELPISIYSPISNINNIYGCFDYLIMPSRFEALPLVALEALSSKLPIIVSNAPDLNEATPDNWPLVFENENINSLKDILENIIQNKYNKEDLSEIGFNFVKNNFDIKNTITLYSNIYLGDK